MFKHEKYVLSLVKLTFDNKSLVTRQNGGVTRKDKLNKYENYLQGLSE